MSDVRVSVAFGFKAWPGGAPLSFWHVDAEMPEHEAQELFGDFERTVEGQGEHFVLSQRRGHSSWGADSGPYFNIVLYLSDAATQGVVGTAAVALIAALARRIRSNEQPTMDQEEAIARAKWIVWAKYGQNAETIESVPQSEEDLSVKGVDHDLDQGLWTITLTASDKSIYEVTLGWVEGVPTVRRLSTSQA